MIKGLGTDLVEVSRMREKIKKEGFLSIVFTKEELHYCKLKKHPSQHFAARFAAKEAFMKAMGTGWSKNAAFNEIEVLNNELGAPYINLHGNTKANYKKVNYANIFLSMSHTSSMASATVIITE